MSNEKFIAHLYIFNYCNHFKHLLNARMAKPRACKVRIRIENNQLKLHDTLMALKL